MRQIEGNLAASEGIHIDIQSVLFGQDAHYLAGGNAAIFIELLTIERQTELCAGCLPGIQMQGHGVHQGAIHIENQGVVLIKPELLGHGSASSWAKRPHYQIRRSDAATAVMVKGLAAGWQWF